MSDEDVLKIISKTFGYDGGRPISVYVPARPIEAIVYCGDGQFIPQWGADLEGGNLPSTMIVGVHRNDDETLRLHEYSPKFDPVRFKQHEDFLVGNVLPWANSKFGLDLPARKTAAFGVSASGEFALAMGVRHPSIFGTVLCASPGAGYKPTEQEISSLPPTYLVAGTREPFFLENALRWADALRGFGSEVVMKERDAGHDDVMWRAEFPKMVSWAFSDIQ